MADETRDAFTAVVGRRRGAERTSREEPPLSDLDRARELAPMVAEALRATDFVGAAIALHRRAAALGVEVLSPRLVSDADDDELDVSLTLLRSRSGAVIAAVDLTCDGRAVLLRPDGPGGWR